MKTRPFLLHALSPLHAGTGQAVDVIDLPIARMRSTGIPIVPGSSIKGVLRDARRATLERDVTFAVFGPETSDASEHAGALVCGDARLLALPVRSFRGTFAWVSSPLLLTLAARDLREGGVATPQAPAPIQGHAAHVSSLDLAVVHERGRVYLEDLDLPVTQSTAASQWAEFLASVALRGDEGLLRSRFVVVDDETMAFLWETATQVDTRVRLQEETRTVARGALWIEESLPPETLLIGLLAADRSRRRDVDLSPERVLEHALGADAVLQFGGKASVGRGRCRMIPVLGGAR